jgi:hypothetical protein
LHVAIIAILTLFVVDLVMVLSRWKRKKAAMDPATKRKNQYEGQIYYTVYSEKHSAIIDGFAF